MGTDAMNPLEFRRKPLYLLDLRSFHFIFPEVFILALECK